MRYAGGQSLTLPPATRPFQALEPTTARAIFSNSPLEGEGGEPNRTKNGRDGAQCAVRAEDGRGGPSRFLLELTGASSGDMRLSDHAARSMI